MADRKINLLYLPLLFFFTMLIYPSISTPSDLFKYHQTSMGTVIEVSLFGEDEGSTEKAAIRGFQEIKRIEYLMSPWIESSDVSRINRAAGKGRVRVSQETFEVVRKAQEISAVSEGGFDITVAPLTQLWRNAREKKVPPSAEELKRKLHLVNFRNMEVDPEEGILLKKAGMAIDLGGIAKGYAVDRAFELLRSAGFKNLIVNAGGDLRAGGIRMDQPWSIGIQHPRVPDKMIARVSLSDAAVATSGDYEKFFLYEGKRYHHIFDPRTGLPAGECQSVTIVSEDGMTADALATAVFVLGPEKGYALCRKLEGVECLIVDNEGKIIFTPGLKGRISLFP
jgi:thiamine biosynthesis lipoprotein